MDSRRATVRNMRSKCRCSCVLQFTFRRAVGCVLHRPPSQVIHCKVLFFFRFVPASGRGSEKRSITGFTTPRGAWAQRKPPSCGRKVFKRHFSPLPAVAGRRVPPSERQKGHRTRAGAGVRQGRPGGRSLAETPSRPGAGELPARGEGRASKQALLSSREVWFECQLVISCPSVMILPQVHLRKPCYDFYFL